MSEASTTIISGNYIGLIGSIVVAVIGGFVSYVIARRTTKDEIRKVRSKFVEKLYEKRIELYPRLWEIADEIYGARKKHKSPEEFIKRNRECLHELRLWKRKSGGYMFFSDKSKKALYKLDDALAANPGDGSSYQPAQIEKIDSARNTFLKALKEDIGIFDDADKEIKLQNKCF